MKTNLILLLAFIFGIQSYAQEKFTVEEISIDEFLVGDLYKSNSTDLVIIIPGSGPTDRNGNQAMMSTNAYKLLAESLADQGTNVFTYDKRFLKQMHLEDFKEEDLSFDDGVEDVVEILQFFKNKNQFKKIYLAGHSEGSLVGILAAQKEKVDGLISIAGSGKGIDEILIQQISAKAPFLVDETTSILSELKKGNQVEEINPFLQALFRKEIQPFMISWLKYDPKVEIGKLNLPILIIQGKKDIQVDEENAELLHQGAPDSKLVYNDEMNHVLKDIEGGMDENMASYNQPELPINQVLVNSIQEFIKSNE